MKKNGFTIVEVFIVIIILGILSAIIIPQLSSAPANYKAIPPDLRTEVSVSLNHARPEFGYKARIAFETPANNWGYDSVQFDTNIKGELQKIYCHPDMGDYIILTPDPNSEYPKSDKPVMKSVKWEVWMERFEKVRRQAETGLRPGAEEFLQKKEQGVD